MYMVAYEIDYGLPALRTTGGSIELRFAALIALSFVLSVFSFVGDCVLSPPTEKEERYLFKMIKMTDFHGGEPLTTEQREESSNLDDKAIKEEWSQLYLWTSWCHESLMFKKGTPVICTLDIDKDRKILKGAQGTITNMVTTEPFAIEDRAFMLDTRH